MLEKVTCEVDGLASGDFFYWQDRPYILLDSQQKTDGCEEGYLVNAWDFTERQTLGFVPSCMVDYPQEQPDFRELLKDL